MDIKPTCEELDQAIKKLAKETSKRKQAQEALRQSEHQIKQYLAIAGVIFVALDDKGYITLINECGLETLGYRREELLGKNWFKTCLPHEIQKDVLGVHHQLMKGEIEPVERYENAVLKKDGGQCIIAWHNTVLNDREGKIVGVLSSGEDITERKRLEKVLRENEAKYRTIIESIEDSYLEVDLGGNFQFFNDSFCRLLGYPRDELLGRNNREFVDKTNADKIFRVFNKVYETETPVFGISWEFIRKDGTRGYVEVSVSLIIDSEGKRAGFRGIGRDVTERKSTEKAILQAKEEWEQTFNAVPDLISILDKNHRIVRANKAMADRLGVSPDELIGKTCHELIHGKKEPPSFCPHSKLLADAREHSAEIYEERLDADFMVSISPIYHKNSDIRGVHVARDITHHKQMEEALRRSEQRFRFLFQSTPDCVVIVDREFNYIYANQAANAYLGLTDDTIEGKNLRDVLAPFPEFRDLWVQRLERFFKSEKPSRAEDSIKMGTEIAWSESSLAAIRDTAEQIVAVGIIYRDTSKRKQMEIEQAKLIAELEYAKMDAEDANQKLERLATLDGLTQLANRRMLDEYLVREWYLQARRESALSVILCDIDYFKRYNDAYGHQAGDECLKRVANKLIDSINRPTDLAARYGGEEFMLVLPDTNGQGAIHVAKRIKTNIRKLKIPHAQSDIDRYLTLSMGVSYAFPNQNQSVELLVRTADEALYEVKANRRNNYLLKECKS